MNPFLQCALDLGLSLDSQPGSGAAQLALLCRVAGAQYSGSWSGGNPHSEVKRLCLVGGDSFGYREFAVILTSAETRFASR
jgi:hypothetical protein